MLNYLWARNVKHKHAFADTHFNIATILHDSYHKWAWHNQIAIFICVLCGTLPTRAIPCCLHIRARVDLYVSRKYLSELRIDECGVWHVNKRAGKHTKHNWQLGGRHNRKNNNGAMDDKEHLAYLIAVCHKPQLLTIFNFVDSMVPTTHTQSHTETERTYRCWLHLCTMYSIGVSVENM